MQLNSSSLHGWLHLPDISGQLQHYIYEPLNQTYVKVQQAVYSSFNSISLFFSAVYYLSIGIYITGSLSLFKFSRLTLDLINQVSVISASISSALCLALKGLEFHKIQKLDQNPLLLLSELSSLKTPSADDLTQWLENYKVLLENIPLKVQTETGRQDTNLYNELLTQNTDPEQFLQTVFDNFNNTYHLDRIKEPHQDLENYFLKKLFQGETKEQIYQLALATNKNILQLSRILKTQTQKAKLFAVLSLITLSLTLIGALLTLLTLFYVLPVSLVIASIIWWGGWGLNIILGFIERSYLGKNKECQSQTLPSL